VWHLQIAPIQFDTLNIGVHAHDFHEKVEARCYLEAIGAQVEIVDGNFWRMHHIPVQHLFNSVFNFWS